MAARIASVHTSIPGFSMPTEDEVNQAADAFRMLSDPTRIKVLWALLQGESSVACLAELAGAAPTVVSQHLAKLRLAGLVKTRREGTFVYYSPHPTTMSCGYSARPWSGRTNLSRSAPRSAA